MKLKWFIMLTLCLFLFSACTPVIDLNGNENSSVIFYNGEEYRNEAFLSAEDDRELIGYLDGKFGSSVYSVGSGEYIEIVGDDNSGFFIKNGIDIPVSGTVTKVLVDPSYSGDKSLYLVSNDELTMIEELKNLSGETQTFEVDNYYTDGNTFYYVYDNSNVSCEDNYGGYVAFTDGKWIYAAAENKSTRTGEGNAVTIEAITIDDPKLIEKMCKTDLTKYIDYK